MLNLSYCKETQDSRIDQTFGFQNLQRFPCVKSIRALFLYRPFFDRLVQAFMLYTCARCDVPKPFHSMLYHFQDTVVAGRWITWKYIACHVVCHSPSCHVAFELVFLGLKTFFRLCSFHHCITCVAMSQFVQAKTSHDANFNAIFGRYMWSKK